MPLLSRNKSAPGSAATNQSTAASNRQQAPGPPPVCESPLFGIRRQLPVSCVISGQAQSSQQPLRSSQQSGVNHNYQDQRQAQSVSARNSSSTPSASSSALKSQHHQQQANSDLHSSSSASDTTTLGSIPKQITRQQIHYAFSIMDTDSDGLIDLRDLSQMLANLGVPIDEAILSHVMSTVSKRGK